MAATKILQAVLAKAAPLDAEKRVVVAWLSQVEDADGNPIVDNEGDSITIDALEDAVTEAFSHGGTARLERQHEQFELGDVIQFFTLSRDEREALGFGPGPAGAIVKVRVTDDQLWDDIKSGKVTDVSFLGMVLDGEDNA